MTTIYKWRLYCVTENTWIYYYLDSSDITGPSLCSNDNAHTINPNSISIIDTISQNVVAIKEESIETGGHYRCDGFTLSIPINSRATKQVSWPIQVSILTATYSSTQDNIGDIINMHSNPIVIGTINATCNIGSNSLSVNATYINNFILGYELILNNGTNSDFLDIITGIDKINNVITFKTAITHQFNSGTPIYIQRRVILDNYIGISSQITLGRNKLQGTYIAANTVLNIEYTNTSLTSAKNFNFEIQYLY